MITCRTARRSAERHHGIESRGVHFWRNRAASALVAVLLLAGSPLPLRAQGSMVLDCNVSPSDSTPRLQAAACLRRSLELANEDTEQGAHSAIAVAQMALQLADSDQDYATQGIALIAIATRYHRMTRYDSSLAYGWRALTLGRQRNDSALQAAALASLSIDYAQIGRPDSALPLAVEMSALCGQPCELAIPVLTFASRYFPASERLETLMKLAAQSANAAPYYRARVFDELGMYYTDVLHRPSEGLVYHRVVDSMKAVDVWTLYGIGRAFRALQMPDSAIDYFFLQLSLARTVGAGWAEAYALGNLGQICHTDFTPPRLPCAIAYYDSTLTLAEGLLRELGSDDNRTTSAEFAWEIYENRVFAVLAAEPIMGEEWVAKTSLAFSDRGRAPALLEHQIAGRRNASMAALPSAVVDSLRADPFRVGGSNTYTLSYFLGRDTLLIWLKLPDQSVQLTRRRITNDSLIMPVESVREELGVASSFVSSRMRGIPTLIPHAPRHVGSLSSSTLSRASALLIPPMLRQLVPPGADVVIVPQSVLALLPFAALPMPRESGGELGLRYAIRYAPSIGVLRGLELLHGVRGDEGASRGHLVASDPKMPRVDLDEVLTGTAGGLTILSDLPSSLAEGAWVAARLGAPNLTGREATETIIRSLLTQSQVIHFATHAVVTEYASQARQSFLAFAPDQSNDGLFTVGELLGMPDGSVPARLVVLSACQTAIGPVRFIEGTMGLQRAFLAKGAESVLASLWSVNDEATEKLMKSFYSHWLDDADQPTKAEALRRAQQEVRLMPGFEHPIYWAGFQLIGLN